MHALLVPENIKDITDAHQRVRQDHCAVENYQPFLSPLDLPLLIINHFDVALKLILIEASQQLRTPTHVTTLFDC